MTLGPKSMACLRLAALPKMSAEWRAGYEDACRQFSEKAVTAKFERLVDRGYLECGVSSRTGWLTPKGRAALGLFMERGSVRPEMTSRTIRSVPLTVSVSPFSSRGRQV